MKYNLGMSGGFWLIVGIAFLVFLGLLPYPHYNSSNSSWYLGPSIAARIAQTTDPGVPLEVVFQKVTKARVTDPFELNCNSNLDCVAYKVTNQCIIYCGNTDASNTKTQTILGNNRVCDPALWKAPEANCSCVQGTCVDLN
jgi:hypothetical protein